MNIDWSMAPADATHFQPENNILRAAWIKAESGYYWFMINAQANWVRYVGPVVHLGTLIPRPIIWNGEGLPPIGSHVVVHDDGSLMYGQGESGEVLAHVEDCAVIRMSYGLGCFLPRCLRTPEQIAAEEREAEIAEIAKEITSCMPYRPEALAKSLHDAGYRKQVSE